MLATYWRLSAAAHRTLRAYMPTNVVIDRLRTRQLKLTLPLTMVAMLAYLVGMSLCVSADGDPGWLNALVLLLFWNAMKCASFAVMTTLRRLTTVVGRPRRRIIARGFEEPTRSKDCDVDDAR